LSILKRIKNTRQTPTFAQEPKESEEAKDHTVLVPPSNILKVVSIPPTTRSPFVPKNTPNLRKNQSEPLIPKTEKSFDPITDVRRGRPGRRTSVPGTKRSRRVAAQVSGLEYVNIIHAAEDQGISVSTMIRVALFDAYGIDRPHPDKVPTIAQAKKRGAKKRQDKRKKAQIKKRRSRVDRVK